MPRRSLAIVALLVVTIAAAPATENAEDLPAPQFKASLLCINIYKGDEGSDCRVTLAKVDGGLRSVKGSLDCGFKGEVSKISWTYLGQKDGHDLYHVIRRFPDDKDAPSTKEADVEFDGKRHVLFEDTHQRIVIELQPPTSQPTSQPG